MEIGHKISIKADTTQADKDIVDFVNRIAKLKPVLNLTAKINNANNQSLNTKQSTANVNAQELKTLTAIEKLNQNNLKTQQQETRTVAEKVRLKQQEAIYAQRLIQLKSQEVLLDQRQLRLKQQQERINKPRGNIGLNSSGNLFGSFASSATGMQLGAVGITAAFVTASDAATNLATQIRYISRSEEESILIRERLFAITQKTYTNIGDVANSLQKNFMSLRERGFSDAQALDFQEAFELIKSQSGANRAEIGGASLQFGQALSADFQGTVGQELNSIIEQLPAVGRLIVEKYNKIEGTNFGLTAIKELARTRKIDAQTVLNAMVDALPQLREKQAQKLKTFADVYTNFGNKIVELTGKFNEGTGFSNAVATTLIELTNHIESLAIVAGGFALNSLVKFAGGLKLVQTVSTGLSSLPLLISGIFSKKDDGRSAYAKDLDSITKKTGQLKSKWLEFGAISFAGLTNGLRGAGTVGLASLGLITRYALPIAGIFGGIATQVDATNKKGYEGITVWETLGSMFGDITNQITLGLGDIGTSFGLTKEDGADFFRTIVTIGLSALDKLVAGFDYIFSYINKGFNEVGNIIETTLLGAESIINTISQGSIGRNQEQLRILKRNLDNKDNSDSSFYDNRINNSKDIIMGRKSGVYTSLYESNLEKLKNTPKSINLKGRQDLLATDPAKDKMPTKPKKGEKTRSDILAGALQSLNNEITLLKESDETKRDVLKTVFDIEKQLADSENVPANQKKLTDMEKEQFLLIANTKKKLEFMDATRQYVKELKNEGEQLSFISSVGGTKNAEAELAVLKFEQEQKMKINNADERNRIIMEQKFLIGQRKNIQLIDTLKNEERSYEFELAKLQLSGVGNEGKLKALEIEYSLETKIQDVKKRDLLITNAQMLADEQRRISMVNNLLNPAKEYEKTLIAINKNAQEYPSVYNAQRVEYEKANAEIDKLSGEITTESGFERGFATIKKSMLDTSQAAEGFVTTVSDGFTTLINDVMTGTMDAGDALRSFATDTLKQLQRLATQELFASAFGGSQSGGLLGSIGGAIGGGGGGSSGGGILSSIIGAASSYFGGGAGSAASSMAGMTLGSTQGFATGGSFTVGGDKRSGDKNLVAFRANAGERVTVAPSKDIKKGVDEVNPSSSANSAPQTVVVNVYLDGKQIARQLDLDKTIVNTVQKNRKSLGIS